MKFAHISDSHLGSWRQPELQELNIKSFEKAINICIEEQVNFVLFTGDLFDSAFPPIETLKETFAQFKKLREEKIKSYIIAGSHDYSATGKTFLDVLEKAGFCEVAKFEEIEDEIVLKPIKHETVYIYGYPGKKSGLEIQDIKKIKIKEPHNHFRILMFHTTISEVAEELPVESIPLKELPEADYYALGHIHIDFEKEIDGKIAIYSGPTFPNNFKELEELKYGSFYIIEVAGFTNVIKKELPLKEVELVELEISDGLKATQQILKELEKKELRDKIVLLRLYGELKQGKTSDIKFQEIEDYLNKQKVYAFLKNTAKLEMEKKELEVQLQPHEMEKIEEVLIKKYERDNPSDFNKFIFPLMNALCIEKQEGEKSANFETRLFNELSKVLEIELD